MPRGSVACVGGVERLWASGSLAHSADSGPLFPIPEPETCPKLLHTGLGRLSHSPFFTLGVLLQIMMCSVQGQVQSLRD